MAGMSPELAQAIIASAGRLGISPVDLGTAISYETGSTFNPGLWGGKGGNYLGLIQFGPEERAKYGVKAGQSAVDQMGAVENFLRDRGVKPGMGMLDVYSTINAGAPDLYNRSDAANGGMPGTVADKVNNQMAEHRRNVIGYLSGGGPIPQDPVSPIDPTTTQAPATSTPLSLAAPVGELAQGQPAGDAAKKPTLAEGLQKLGGQLTQKDDAPMALQQIQIPQVNPQAQALAAQIARNYGFGV